MKYRFDRNALAMFNEKDGTKVRLSLGKYKKAKRPELVDIKITDYCPFGCSFCYQASTLQGQHATSENMQFIIRELKKAKIFEVALGGGEPTDYPDFIQLLKDFYNAGITPNFTTKSMGWVKRHWNDIEPYVGAFAYSAEKINDLNKANLMFKDVPHSRINIHYVMGLDTMDNFVLFLKRAAELDFRVTLLGYKTVGRGADVIPYPYDQWVQAVDILVALGKCPTLSIDTPLAAQYDGKMPITTQSYHTKEGYVSAYIDAVSMRMGTSSFENLNSLVPFDENWKSIYKQEQFVS